MIFLLPIMMFLQPNNMFLSLSTSLTVHDSISGQVRSGQVSIVKYMYLT